MPMIRYQIRNEYGLANPELYGTAERDDPEALLEAVAMAGLVGLLRQLGDLAEFAAEIFHDLHEEVMATAARGHGLMLRVQQLEAEFPSIEKTFFTQTNNPNFACNDGIDWHANIQMDLNLITQGDMPRFILDSYEECRGPPHLFTLDKFDVAGAGACLKRYSDPSFFKMELASSGMLETELPREKKARKIKKKGSRWKNGRTLESLLAPDADSDLQQITSDQVSEKSSRHVKLKTRHLNGMGKSNERGLMERLLEIHSSEQKVLFGNSISHSHVKINPIDSNESATVIREIAVDSLAERPLVRETNLIQSPTEKEVAGLPLNELEMRKIKNKELSEVLHDSFDELKKTDSDYLVVKQKEMSTESGYKSEGQGSVNGCVFSQPETTSLQVVDQNKLLGDAEYITEGGADGYRSDDISSELDNFVDALNTMESELETDCECRGKAEPGVFNMESHGEYSDINEAQQELQIQFSEQDSVDNSAKSLSSNTVLNNEITSISDSDTSSLAVAQPTQRSMVSLDLPANSEICSAKTYNSTETDCEDMENSDLSVVVAESHGKNSDNSEAQQELQAHLSEPDSVDNSTKSLSLNNMFKNETTCVSESDTTTSPLVAQPTQRNMDSVDFPANSEICPAKIYDKTTEELWQNDEDTKLNSSDDLVSSSCIGDSTSILVSVHHQGSFHESQSVARDQNGLPSGYEASEANEATKYFDGPSLESDYLELSHPAEHVEELISEDMVETFDMPDHFSQIEDRSMPGEAPTGYIEDSLLPLIASIIVESQKSEEPSTRACSGGDKSPEHVEELISEDMAETFDMPDHFSQIEDRSMSGEAPTGCIEDLLLPLTTSIIVESQESEEPDTRACSGGYKPPTISAFSPDINSIASKPDNLAIELGNGMQPEDIFTQRSSSFLKDTHNIAEEFKGSSVGTKHDDVPEKMHPSDHSVELNSEDMMITLDMTNHHSQTQDKCILKKIPLGFGEDSTLSSTGHIGETQESMKQDAEACLCGSTSPTNPALSPEIGFTVQPEGSAAEMENAVAPSEHLACLTVGLENAEEMAEYNMLVPNTLAPDLEYFSDAKEPQEFPRVVSAGCTHLSYVEETSPNDMQLQCNVPNHELLECPISVDDSLKLLDELTVHISQENTLQTGEPTQCEDIVGDNAIFEHNSDNAHPCSTYSPETSGLQVQLEEHGIPDVASLYQYPVEKQEAISPKDKRVMDSQGIQYTALPEEDQPVTASTIFDPELSILYSSDPPDSRLVSDVCQTKSSGDVQTDLPSDNDEANLICSLESKQDFVFKALPHGGCDGTEEKKPVSTKKPQEFPHVVSAGCTHLSYVEEASPSDMQLQCNVPKHELIECPISVDDSLKLLDKLTVHISQENTLQTAEPTQCEDMVADNAIFEHNSDNAHPCSTYSPETSGLQVQLQEHGIPDVAALYRYQVEKQEAISPKDKRAMDSQRIQYTALPEEDQPVTASTAFDPELSILYSSDPSDSILPTDVCQTKSSGDVQTDLPSNNDKANLICSLESKQDFVFKALPHGGCESTEEKEPLSTHFLSEPTIPLEEAASRLEVGSELIVLPVHQEGEHLDLHAQTIDLNDEPSEEGPELRSHDSSMNGDVSELETPPSNKAMCWQVEPEASISSACSSELISSSLASNVPAVMLPSFTSSDVMVLETSSQLPVEPESGKPVSSFPFQDVEEPPPLPPLPPLEWRRGKLELGSLSSFGSLFQPPSGTNRSMVPSATDWKNGCLLADEGEMVKSTNPFVTIPVLEAKSSQHGLLKSEGEKMHPFRLSELPPIAGEEGHQHDAPFLEGKVVYSSNPCLVVSPVEDEKHPCSHNSVGGVMLQPSNRFASLSVLEDEISQCPPLLQGETLQPSGVTSSQLDQLLSSELERDQESEHGHLSLESKTSEPPETFLVQSDTEDEKCQYRSGICGAENMHLLQSSVPVPTMGPELPKLVHVTSREDDQSSQIDVLPTPDDENSNVKPRSIRNRPRDPLIEAVAAHDRSTMRKVSEIVRPSNKPKAAERDSLLEQIRSKSFNLKPAVVTKPNIKGPTTNLKVAAIIEKANAIRQAFVGSDEDNEDSWSDS
ncbi:SCAR-like protein 1 isoform X1 [Elaeis guineensis]|uniref:SCAR-like protein 1 isoform X1 n=1 Tax=Elaeis guineensis var. tenera TaxID=51953 RepID=UPI00057B179E